MNQGSNFLGDSFSNRDNVRASIQFRTDSEPQHLKRWFFLKNKPINFHVNRASVTRLIKWNQMSFSSIEINKPLLPPVQCLVNQIQVQLLPQIRCLITVRVKSSIISIYSNITDNTVREVIKYTRKSIASTMEPWETPALTGYSCEDFPTWMTWSCLLLWKGERKLNIWPENQ